LTHSPFLPTWKNEMTKALPSCISMVAVNECWPEGVGQTHSSKWMQVLLKGTAADKTQLWYSITC
jgi:hypothetical protein